MDVDSFIGRWTAREGGAERAQARELYNLGAFILEAKRATEAA